MLQRFRGMEMRLSFAILFSVFLLASAEPVRAQLLPRDFPAAGSVIARKSGEEVQFIDISGWRFVDLDQDLLGGDVLRTNANGHLAILFADRTQIRMARNTTLVVKSIGGDGAEFGLEQGTIWARAERGGTDVTVETPAAAAAVRGTDWTLSVEPDGRTSLIVLEGVVDLSNEFGAVSVAAGEAAVASIGSAPTKIVIVDPKDREQMLFYLSLRSSFTSLPASPLTARQARDEQGRLDAIPPERRSAEDWTDAAELALTSEGHQAAAALAARARAASPSPAQAARLNLVEALIAGANQDYVRAAELFARAERGLSGERRAVAAYGGYFARSLADPSRVEAAPAMADAGPAAVFAEALTAGFLRDIPAAIAVVAAGEAVFPESAALPALRARLAMLIDDREQALAAIERAITIDPQDPDALQARAAYRSGFLSDLEGALADLTAAAELRPGSSSIWNDLGLVQIARGADREAEAALRRAIAVEPNDPVARANLAILLLDQGRLREAKVLIDEALALDPSFEIGLVARGRYYLQTGERDKALQDLLAGTTANPGYAQGLLLLGAAHYESGSREAGAQALENADRLDPNDPVIALARTAVAIDDYDVETALDSAQEAMRRARARGGDFAPVGANRDAGSTLNDAFRLAGLDAWGRYYGDVVFDPFSPAGFVDQAIAGSADPFANAVSYGATTIDAGINQSGFSSLLQGLALDPTMIAGQSRSAALVERPFVEGSLAGGFTVEGGADPRWTGAAEIQSYAVTPVPWSLNARLNRTEAESVRPAGPGDFTMLNTIVGGNGYLTAEPTPNDHLVTYFNGGEGSEELGVIIDPADLPAGVFDADFSDRRDNRTLQGGVIWNHSFGFRNSVSTGLFLSDVEESSRRERLFDLGELTGSTLDIETRQRAAIGAVSHSIGTGDTVWRYGIEGGMVGLETAQTTTVFLPVVGGVSDTIEGQDDVVLARTYVDVVHDLTPMLKIEAAAFGTLIEGSAIDVARLEPRLGVAWTPLEGHWLRAGFLRETAFSDFTTLSPVGLLGLQSNQAPLEFGGYADTFAARWDAEWTDRFFTSLDFQHQDFHDLSIGIPATLETIDIERGRIDRIALSANARLGYGFGAAATVAYADSENRDPLSPGFGQALPYVPELSARLGLTYVHPSNLKVTLAQSYIGPRLGNEAGTELGGYWTTDAFLTFEPFDKRFALELAAYNLFDQRFDIAADEPGTTLTPGWGRAFVGSLKIRF